MASQADLEQRHGVWMARLQGGLSLECVLGCLLPALQQQVWPAHEEVSGSHRRLDKHLSLVTFRFKQLSCQLMCSRDHMPLCLAGCLRPLHHAFGLLLLGTHAHSSFPRKHDSAAQARMSP